ncbi:hypothetical protein CLV59_103424 [Chitinophaga dinghuensis]|uniref:Uncharacterized protein n=1 Tax=Chitinophaga dinghuensis TaxID=1539050 RepID=A0A327W505_9BACT|nr:hypothetical protein [Chitinophaga dinghuensis]RAJ83456.1 hypothetical protein CLV59_103424 [Chitinophaga dinghuensis]
MRLIMNPTAIRYLPIVLLMVVILNACSHRIDKVSKSVTGSVMQGEMNYYSDSNILIYRSNVKLTADKEIFNPKSFYAKLPKGIACWTFSNSSSFIFLYPHNQAIAINVRLDNISLSDTTFIPNELEIDSFLNREISGSNNCDVRKIRIRSNRKQCFIQKGAATIFLYNIAKTRFSKYVDDLQQFRFLDN